MNEVFQMEEAETNGQEISIPISRAYRIALILGPIILLLYGTPYIILWWKPFTEKLKGFSLAIFGEGHIGVLYPYLTKGSLALVAGIFIHELLHGLGWVPFAKRGFRSLKFGFMKVEMAPYAHCKDPLPVYAYRIGILLPGIILGILPAFIGIITGNFSWLCYGILFTWAASGDFIMFWMIRYLKRNAMVVDHPDKLGCIII